MKAATATAEAVAQRGKISIHAAREGGDEVISDKIAEANEFQSTPPVKAATFGSTFIIPDKAISIHAAREGGDVRSASAADLPLTFQSTPPVKAATAVAFSSVGL